MAHKAKLPEAPDTCPSPAEARLGAGHTATFPAHTASGMIPGPTQPNHMGLDHTRLPLNLA